MQHPSNALPTKMETHWKPLQLLNALQGRWLWMGSVPWRAWRTLSLQSSCPHGNDCPDPGSLPHKRCCPSLQPVPRALLPLLWKSGKALHSQVSRLSGNYPVRAITALFSLLSAWLKQHQALLPWEGALDCAAVREATLGLRISVSYFITHTFHKTPAWEVTL